MVSGTRIENSSGHGSQAGHAPRTSRSRAHADPLPGSVGETLARELRAFVDCGKDEPMSDSDVKSVQGPLTPPAALRPWTSEVCNLVNERYKELGAFQEKLETRSRRLRRIGRTMKGSLVVLGALSATKATFDAFMDPSAEQGIALFALLGVLTTIFAGLSAAFKPEESGGQLAGLAAEVASTRGIILYTWDRILLEHAGTLASVTHDGSEVKLVEELLERLNVKTADIYTRAAGLGMQPPKGPAKLREFGAVATPQPQARDRSLPHMVPTTATA